MYLTRETETNQDLLDAVLPMTNNAQEELNVKVMCLLFGNNYINAKIYIQDKIKGLKLSDFLADFWVQIACLAK